MKTRRIPFEEWRNYAGNSSETPADNRPELKRMSAAVRLALQHELTERQQTCIQLYYYENRTIPEIAKTLNVNKSTVSRHLSKGRQVIRKVVSYACADRLSDAFSPKS